MMPRPMNPTRIFVPLFDIQAEDTSGSAQDFDIQAEDTSGSAQDFDI
jgi:hypothetical protein